MWAPNVELATRQYLVPVQRLRQGRGLSLTSPQRTLGEILDMKEAGTLRPNIYYLPGEQGTRDKTRAMPEGSNTVRTDSQRSQARREDTRVKTREDPTTEEQNAISGPSSRKSVSTQPGSIPRDP